VTHQRLHGVVSCADQRRMLSRGGARTYLYQPGGAGSPRARGADCDELKTSAYFYYMTGARDVSQSEQRHTWQPPVQPG